VEGAVNTDQEYIGDGVYASFDGYHIWLRTERDDVVHTIALEPQVLEALVTYRHRLIEKYMRKDKHT